MGVSSLYCFTMSSLPGVIVATNLRTSAYRSASSTCMELKSSVSTSRSSAVVVSSSACTLQGAETRFSFSVMSAQLAISCRRSLSSSATLLPSATVRTITPKFCGLMLCIRRRRRLRSSEPLIFCDIDILLLKGVSTR